MPLNVPMSNTLMNITYYNLDYTTLNTLKDISIDSVCRILQKISLKNIYSQQVAANGC